MILTRLDIMHHHIQKGKHEHITHNTALDDIIIYYIAEFEKIRLKLNYIIVWNDNCTGQYKCHHNIYNIATLPSIYDSVKVSNHRFAQVF